MSTYISQKSLFWDLVVSDLTPDVKNSELLASQSTTLSGSQSCVLRLAPDVLALLNEINAETYPSVRDRIASAADHLVEADGLLPLSDNVRNLLVAAVVKIHASILKLGFAPALATFREAEKHVFTSDLSFEVSFSSDGSKSNAEASSDSPALHVSLVNFVLQCAGALDHYFSSLVYHRYVSVFAQKDAKDSLSAPHLIAQHWKSRVLGSFQATVDRLQSLLQERMKYSVTEELEESYLEAFTSNDETVIRRTFADLKSRLLAIMSINHRCADVQILERFLVALHGSDIEDIADDSIRLLNAVYDGHTWQLSRESDGLLTPTAADAAASESAASSTPSTPKSASVTFMPLQTTPKQPPSLQDRGPFVPLMCRLGDAVVIVYRTFDVNGPVPRQEGNPAYFTGPRDLYSSVDDFNAVVPISAKIFQNSSGSIANAPSFLGVAVARVGRDESFSYKDVVKNADFVSLDEASGWRRTDLHLEISVPTPRRTQPTRMTIPIVVSVGSQDFYALPLLTGLRCGMWDYRIRSGSATVSAGRIMIQPDLRTEVMHDVWVDCENARWGSHTAHGTEESIRQAGTFADVGSKISAYRQRGVTAVHLTGAMERFYFHPYAPVERAVPSASKGGITQFQKLMSTAHGSRIKVVVGTTTRVSAKNAHRKYFPSLVYTSDNTGRLMPHYAIDGRDIEWQDSVLLNYRNLDTWNLYVNELKEWIAKADIDGLRIDHAHLTPLLKPVDKQEMYRKDADGVLHWSRHEILIGTVVQPHYSNRSVAGFFETRACTDEGFPNPFFVKVARALWAVKPDFWILGDTDWDRDAELLVSGVIPCSPSLQRMIHSLPVLSQSFSKPSSPLAARLIAKYPIQNRSAYLTQRTHSSILPLNSSHPWTMLDLMYLLPWVPCTSSIELDTFPFSVDITTGRRHRMNVSFSQQFLEEYVVSRTSLRRRYDVLLKGELEFVPSPNPHQIACFIRWIRATGEMCFCAVNMSPSDAHWVPLSIPKSAVVRSDEMYSVSRVEPKGKVEYFYGEEIVALSGVDMKPITFQVTPSSSLCLLVSPMQDTVSSRRLVVESSLRRCLECQDHALPSHHFYKNVLKALQDRNRSDEFFDLIKRYASVLTPPLERDLLPAVLHRVLFHAVQQETAKEVVVASYLRSAALNKQGIDTVVFDVCRSLLERNKLGSIVMVTPEIAPWSKIGGVAVMVDALAQDLASMGLEVHVLSPYYNKNNAGKTDYLKEDGIFLDSIIQTNVGFDTVNVGLHYVHRNNVHYYFLHHADIFPVAYRSGRAMDQCRTVVLLARAALETLCQKHILPAVIVTHDWPSGLVAAYTKLGYYGSSFRGATLMHVVHNLEEGYQGRIYPEAHLHAADDHFGWIHQLPDDVVWDPYIRCIDSSRAALRMSDQWGTVSLSYRNDLLSSSSYAYVLRKYARPFAYSNGIRVAVRRAQMAKIAPSHEAAKEIVQKKYFGRSEPSVPVFSFVGRITEQKGVHLIVDAVEHLMYTYSGKLMIIIGGQANYTDPYAARCGARMRALRSLFPNQFWCDPDAFFADGPLVNIGSDFGLMPSLFEPGGQVQQEYFAAGTPVVAFATGGLKDTVSEFDVDSERGNGFLFLGYRVADFINCVDRCMRVYERKDQYERLRENAERSVLDSMHVSRQWGKEFARLRGCLWVEDVINEMHSLQTQNSVRVVRTTSGASSVPEWLPPVPHVQKMEQKLQNATAVAQSIPIHSNPTMMSPAHSAPVGMPSTTNWYPSSAVTADLATPATSGLSLPASSSGGPVYPVPLPPQPAPAFAPSGSERERASSVPSSIDVSTKPLINAPGVVTATTEQRRPSIPTPTNPEPRRISLPLSTNPQ
eukprot:ANDGO_05608.mRNA.1 Glycogen synthase